mmetsp:Transcript_14459/g.12740  ORF Transcript_14459/g.12740 Transcript_14459/m.12740 type:complete len:107 (-) Transcript_14459:40-360(-)
MDSIKKYPSTYDQPEYQRASHGHHRSVDAPIPQQPPAGSYQMSEEDISETLAKLELKKKDITTMIYRLPIANRHKAIEDREKELYIQLDEINDTINKLHNHRVFIA